MSLARVRAVVSSLPFVAGGCFLFHSPDHDPAVPADAGAAVVDAGPVPGREGGVDGGAGIDTGLPVAVDAGPLPDDEPDVAPDERPSDDPSAGDWRDPPPPADPASPDPCCDVIGEPVPLDDPAYQAGRPAVAWNGTEFGVAWYSSVTHAAFFRTVRADGTAGPEEASYTGIGGEVALAWGNHRYALLGGAAWRAPYESPGALGVLDEDGLLRVGAVAVPRATHGGAVARYPAAHGWVVASASEVEGAAVPVRVLVYDDALEPAGVEHDLGAMIGLPVLVEVKSRFVVVAPADEGIVQHTFSGRALDRPIAPGVIADPGTYVNERGLPQRAWAVGAGRLRDSVVVASMNGTELSTLVFDPFTGEVLADIAPLVANPEYASRPGLAGDDVRGVIGVCYPSGEGPFGGYTDVTGTGRDEVRTGPPDASEIRFALLGPDGRPVGAPVTVIDAVGYAESCAVASHDGEWLVAWWAAGGVTRPAIFVRRVRMRD